ncbi:phospholipase A2 [Streptomyces sp. NPDC001922]|uniref:phospholipase A2 n=1 Tax=Streptomyces sp. NPDC001922 TaxID=3364624 RepID=UPI0036CA1740
MKTIRTSFGGVVLAGVLALGTAAPALAAPPSEAAAAVRSHSVVGQQAVAGDETGPTVGGAYRLRKLKSLTSKGRASSEAWYEYLALYRHGSNFFRFNWKTDGCTNAPDKLPGGYDFYYACYRHDFGYRNYKKIVGKAKFRRWHKKRVDQVFLQEMRWACQWKPWPDPVTRPIRKQLKAACLKSANKYYAAVRVLG